LNLAVPPALTNAPRTKTKNGINQERHRCEGSEEISYRREDQEMRTLCSRPFAVASLAIGALTLSALQTQGAEQTQGADLTQTNLVSNIPGLAKITDPQLVNPWGVSHSPTSPFWTSNQGKNTATLYAVTDKTTVTKVNINPPTGFVLIPTTASGPQGPTGQVNNTNTSSFPVARPGGTSAHFIFANLNGTISAWDTGPTAFVQITGGAGTSYTGLAINRAQTRLYAANTSAGRIDVFDSNFMALDLVPNAFRDPSLPTGLVPFNVRQIDGNVYVLYAPAGRPAQIAAPLGAGAVAVFDEDGNFIRELVSGSRLAAPWGITIAPPGFRRFSNDVLVGNFSFLHSEINAFIPSNGKLHGTIPIDTGKQGAGGLWAIDFGVGGNNGSPDVLYFSDGMNGEADGLFGAIAAH
jgi:uncharacterized protein (TIGR03118 family)